MSTAGRTVSGEFQFQFTTLAERVWVVQASTDLDHWDSLGTNTSRAHVFPFIDPDAALFRIDLMIGEKAFWGQGWGTRIIRLLTDYGFERCEAGAVFGVGVADYNPRSRRAFEKNGYAVDQTIPQPAGSKAREEYDMVMTRDAWRRRRADRQGG